MTDVPDGLELSLINSQICPKMFIARGISWLLFDRFLSQYKDMLMTTTDILQVPTDMLQVPTDMSVW